MPFLVCSFWHVYCLPDGCVKEWRTRMIPSTTERVPQHTAESVNEQIRRRTEADVARVSAAGRQAIDHRIAELDREWDIERTLEANAATAVLVGTVLGATVDRRFFAFPAVVAGFLLQHAVQGWCPPLPLFRRAGFRTAAEIDYERYALKAIRGDFKVAEHVINGTNEPARMVDAARKS
jgi:F0F1-type ATP synthase assembly protein I